jgi:hypothetical protein
MGACANSVSGDSTQPTGTTSIVISPVSSAASRIGKTHESPMPDFTSSSP